MEKSEKIKSLNSRSGAIAFAKRMLKDVDENFVRDGYLQPVWMLMVGCNPKTGKPFPRDRPEVIMFAPMNMKDDEAKNDVVKIVSDILYNFAGIGVLSVNEAWITEIPKDYRPDVKDCMEKAKLAQDEARKNNARKEVAIVVLEHIEIKGSMVWMAPILRPVGGRSVLGEWNSSDYSGITGRFAEILVNTRKYLS